MLVLVEISAVVASLAVVVIAVAAVRAMNCIAKATEQANEFTREARETLASVRGVVAPIRRVVDRFEPLGERAADLSASVLESVEAPIQTAVAASDVMRSVAGYFLERLSRRFTHGRAATHGGSDNEQGATGQ